MQKWECIEIIKPLTLNSSKEKLERVVALLNKYAPIKQKIMGFNNNSFLSKAFRKAIIHRSKLKKYNKYRTEGNWVNYKKERNFCVNLLRKTKTEYFQKLNVKDLSNRKFWKTIKSFFSNKGLLKENNRLITEKKESLYRIPFL